MFSYFYLRQRRSLLRFVWDVDTIEVRGIAIRLDGVDAPDKGQLGFKEGKDWMKRNYAGRMVRCDLTGAKT